MRNNCNSEVVFWRSIAATAMFLQMVSVFVAICLLGLHKVPRLIVGLLLIAASLWCGVEGGRRMGRSVCSRHGLLAKDTVIGGVLVVGPVAFFLWRVVMFARMGGSQ